MKYVIESGHLPMFGEFYEPTRWLVGGSLDSVSPEEFGHVDTTPWRLPLDKG